MSIQGLFESDTTEREETVFDPHNGPVDCNHLLLVPVKATDVQSHKSWAYVTGWTTGTTPHPPTLILTLKDCSFVRNIARS